MRYTFTFPESCYDAVCAHLIGFDDSERAGYVFAGMSRCEDETRLIAREFWPVRDEHIISRSRVHLSIRPESYIRALQHADETGQSFWFIHSHPEGFEEFSRQDDAEEPGLFRTAYIRVGGERVHGSIVFPCGGEPFGRAWLDAKTTVPLARIRSVGERFRFADPRGEEAPIAEFFDRQVRAFGEDIQRLLARLHIAVVGAGGTGSAVCEQLIRLGVGRLSIYDPDTLDGSNVNRVYGSGVSAAGVLKVRLIEELAARIGLGTVVRAFPRSIYDKETARTLREADLIFGCTDEDFGRSILNEIALRYAIPVIDMGIRIDSEAGRIRSICGRVTVLQPGAACLWCRGRISAERVAEDSRRHFTPDEAETRRREGYAPELVENNPAVIPFTTAVAAGAVAELLHRLTGFMGGSRATSETLFRFDQNEVGKNAEAPRADCRCAQPAILASGDTRDFLGMLWA
jgi:hypothetical protein